MQLMDQTATDSERLQCGLKPSVDTDFNPECEQRSWSNKAMITPGRGRTGGLRDGAGRASRQQQVRTEQFTSATSDSRGLDYMPPGKKQSRLRYSDQSKWHFSSTAESKASDKY